MENQKMELQKKISESGTSTQEKWQALEAEYSKMNKKIMYDAEVR